MIYLDNAATTFPKPESVICTTERVQRCFAANPGRGGHKLSVKAGRIVFEAREKLAEMFGAQSDRVVFTLNCTHAINTALKGLLRPGNHVIISSLEHNSVLRPIEKLSEQGLISYDVALVDPQDEEKTVEAFKKHINPKTRMIMCTHVSNVFGTVLPIEKLAALAKKHHLIFGVDAAQSAGTFSIDMKKIGIDFLCMPGHKGLFGPMGTGVLILSDGIEPDSLTEGGTGSMSLEIAQPSVMPDKLESGTVNLPGIAGLSTGIDFLKSVGTPKEIHERETCLVKTLIEDLHSINGITVYDNMHGEISAPVISFNVKDFHSERTAELLDEFGFAVRGGYQCSLLAHNSCSTVEKGTVRVSPGLFNTKKEIKNLSFCLNKIALTSNL